MNVSERNKKVAIARWKKKHSEEKNKIKQDEETLILKASICGFLAGDGSVQKRREKNFYHYQIDFFPDDKLMLDTYVQQIKEVYNKSPKIKKEVKFYSVRFSSKIVVEDLFNIAEFGLKVWTLPTSIFKIKGAKEKWLKAFFSAEAYVNEKTIKIQTINRNGMKEVSKLLNNMKISHKYYEYNSRKETESLVSIITINRKDSRLKFCNTIGFWHTKKTKILKESLGL